MNKLYQIMCLTNLHVGSGDINFSVVDKEVEKDPATDDPVIHASGIKGALREEYKGEKENEIFGTAGDNNNDDSSGKVKFFDAVFLCRPLRACGCKASVPVTTVDAVNRIVELTEAFGLTKACGLNRLENIDFGENEFLCTAENIQVEGEKTGKLDENNDGIQKLKRLIGEDFALAKSFENYPLPVIARNNLTASNRNLWYEEFVPHGSQFLEIMIVPTEDLYAAPKIVQIGGNASIGYGFCSFNELSQNDSTGKETK